MLNELSSSLMDNSIYHIIEFNDGTLSDQATFFVVNINEYGFVKADIIFPEELDVMNILPMVQRIHYHRIDLLKPDTTEITEKIRIKVVFSEYTKQIILEADNQCWYVGVDNGFFNNFYYQRTLELLLFIQTLPKLYNGETRKVTYASFYETQYRYLNHIRRNRFKSFKSEEEKEAYEKWERMEYRKCCDEYFYLLHYSHPKRYENDAETFKKWAEETETRYQERNERLESRNKHLQNNT
ncbi:hypothetical protein B4079_3153 [Bacillus cereus]|uniref:hypothetical protein n=1 Tax=Bacillus paranthracis TaxID=2026186 RepID=UPI000789CACF|nr:hypothetical protein [Bacillus paranthracis]KYQ01871.1 hypothetical protein B4079_3153 [Bacillus cereus]